MFTMSRFALPRGHRPACTLLEHDYVEPDDWWPKSSSLCSSIDNPSSDEGTRCASHYNVDKPFM